MTQPRRIAIIATKMDSGGTVNVAVQLATGLRDRGHDVQIWFLYVSRPTLVGRPGIHAIFPGKPRGPFDYARIAKRVFAALRSFRPDAVHAIMPLGNVVGLTAARVAGCRSRVASQHQPYRSLRPAIARLDMIAGKTGVYSANVAVSESVRSSFAGHPQRYRDQVVVIPNGVQERLSTLSPQAARASFGLPAAAALVGTLGRLAPEKNHAFLLKLLVALPQVHLAIGGAGELEGDLRRTAAELGVEARVHLLGQVPAERIPDLMRALDIFLFPSIFEGMPIALLEAMMAGLPIVASDIPPTREVAAGCATLIETATSGPWEAEIRRLLDDAEARGALGLAARARAKDFTNDAMIDAYERLLLAPDNGRSLVTAGCDRQETK